ncbi:MAG TPA: PhzF family phenazine biosynthesis protein [Burkholderiales bacterium]|jgi:PhzF family phenazine biosynthesis protein
MRYQYRLQNVFALSGQTLTGNPLCVFEDAWGLTDAQMQALALQFNLSETTFVLPADGEATAKVRIFTPGAELPFAGHPTLGTAHTVRDLKSAGDQIKLEMQAGVIPVSAKGDRWTLRANAASTRPFDPERIETLLVALGLSREDLAADPLWVDAGMEQLLVPLVSRYAVKRIVPGAALSEFPNNSGKVSVYCFSSIDEPDMLVRFFFHRTASAIGEDPATGSAVANLGGYMLHKELKGPLARTLLQGEFTGRPSQLQLVIAADGRVLVTGEVIELGRGHIDL